MKKTALILTSLALIFALTKITTAPAYADPLTVAPARQQLEMNPGETSTAILKLMNHGNTITSGTLKAVDFIVTGDQGIPEFLESETLTSNYSAASWIKLPFDRLSIPAQDKLEIQFKINAPPDALPGGHYTAIIFEAGAAAALEKSTTSQTGRTAIAPRLAALLYITVPGDYEESALITRFQAPKFSQNGPIDFDTTILNQSPIHIRPTGAITITNMFNDVVAYLPLEEANIFPNTEKAFRNTLPTKWLFGRYQAHLSAAYGSQGKVLESTILFTVLPVMLTLYIIILIIALFIIIRFLIIRNRRYQQELEKEVQELKHEIEEIEHKT